MKKAAYLLIALLMFSCGSVQKTPKSDLPEEAVKIANEELEYEIIIIDVGFRSYLLSIAQPANFYSLEYYEQRNRVYVNEWNNRHRDPMRYNPNIYQNEINYDPNIRYGLDVNYKLYNYFKFVEYKYKERFFYTRN